jgi:hypothetical protein
MTMDPLDLEPEDITPEVCQRCAMCCRMQLEARGDHRQLPLMEIVFRERLVVARREPCACGCGGETFEGHVVETCPRLEEQDDGRLLCSDYENRPQLCRDYNCVAWAKVNGHGHTDYTRRAKQVIESLRPPRRV